MNTTPYLTPAQAAALAGVKARCLHTWCHRYPGLALKVGGRWRVNPAAMDRLLMGQPVSESASVSAL